MKRRSWDSEPQPSGKKTPAAPAGPPPGPTRGSPSPVSTNATVLRKEAAQAPTLKTVSLSCHPDGLGGSLTLRGSAQHPVASHTILGARQVIPCQVDPGMESHARPETQTFLGPGKTPPSEHTGSLCLEDVPPQQDPLTPAPRESLCAGSAGSTYTWCSATWRTDSCTTAAASGGLHVLPAAALVRHGGTRGGWGPGMGSWGWPAGGPGGWPWSANCSPPQV